MLSTEWNTCALCDAKSFFSTQVLHRHVLRKHKLVDQSSLEKMTALTEKAKDFINNAPKMSRRKTMKQLLEKANEWTKDDSEKQLLMLRLKTVTGPMLVRTLKRDGRKRRSVPSRSKGGQVKIAAKKTITKADATLIYNFRIFQKGDEVFVTCSNKM